MFSGSTALVLGVELAATDVLPEAGSKAINEAANKNDRSIPPSLAFLN